MAIKKCSKCGELKNINKFSNYKKSIDGKQSYCKACNKDYQKTKHNIDNNNWKLYRLTINIKELDLRQKNSYYIGITKKELKDRLNEHISNIKNRCHSNFWIMEMFKRVDLKNIKNKELKKYIKIELLKEYPKELTVKEIEAIEKKAVIEQSKYCQEAEEWTTDVLNLQHHEGNLKWKNDIENRRKNDILKKEKLNVDRKKILSN